MNYYTLVGYVTERRSLHNLSLSLVPGVRGELVDAGRVRGRV